MKQTKKIIATMLATILLSTHLLSLSSVVKAEGENAGTQSGQSNTETVETPVEKRVTRAELNIDENKKNLSTVIENKDVEMKIVLDTSSTKYALYKNPTFEIEMPEEVEEVTLTDVKLLFEYELEIKESEVVTKNGKKIISFVLEGEQTEYFTDLDNDEENDTVIAKGATIVIKANITVKKMATSKTADVMLYYTNENTNLYESNSVDEQTGLQLVAEKGVTKDQINIVAQTGVTAATIITGYQENTEFVNMTSEEKQFIVSTMEEKKTLTIQGMILNNNAEEMEGVLILGRVPSQNTVQFESTEDLGSNFSLTMKKEIEVERNRNQ